MMEMLDISIPNSNPYAGRRQSLSLPPSLIEGISKEETMFSPKRRGIEANVRVARADGFYTRGRLKYKLRKGDRLPDKNRADEIFYYGDSGVEREDVVTATDAFAETLVADEAVETATEEEGESPEKPKRGGRRKASE